MRSGTYYLNNNGSKWVIFENGKRIKETFQLSNGKTIERSVNYFASFGNFGTCNISYKGKKIDVFVDTVLCSEHASIASVCECRKSAEQKLYDAICK